MKLITEHHIRHVPITRDGKLVGIVSIGDVVKRLLEKYEQEAELIKQFINSYPANEYGFQLHQLMKISPPTQIRTTPVMR